jgi:lipid A 3-O-deacylase
VRASFRYGIRNYARNSLHAFNKLRGVKNAGYLMTRILQVAFLAALFCCAPAIAQTRPQDGGHEIEFWAGGGHGTNGSTSSDGVFNAGARFGWILTKPHGPGFLRGNFEFAVDAVPVFVVFQPANKAYGAGFDPVVLKWNFETDSRIVPYVELAGGVLFTNVTVPTGTSQTNFTSGAAVGIHILGERVAWSVDLRYMHISNAGLTTPNPGINTVQVRVGVGWFFRGHHK